MSNEEEKILKTCYDNEPRRSLMKKLLKNIRNNIQRKVRNKQC
jgi:hypothetical protein